MREEGLQMAWQPLLPLFYTPITSHNVTVVVSPQHSPRSHPIAIATPPPPLEPSRRQLSHTLAAVRAVPPTHFVTVFEILNKVEMKP